MRFHILGLSFTQTTREYSACAFTQKIRLLCKMLYGNGHEVIHYGTYGSDPECSENVNVLDLATFYAVHKSYDYKKTGLLINQTNPAYLKFTQNSIEEIKRRAKPGDFLICPFGTDHLPQIQAFPELIAVEPGIGYENTAAPFRVFESYAWMNYIYGKEGRSLRPSFYDAVIPNFFDVNDFPYVRSKDDYFIFIGRPTPLKGLRIASDVCKEIGAKLYAAGYDNPEPGIEAEHLGVLSIEDRAKWVSRAKALFAPTYYIEPFGYVTVESMLYGTPVISTDFGAFPENVIHGKTGFRCRTFEQFVWAAKNIGVINPDECRIFATKNFSLGAVYAMYEEYFESLSSLHIKDGAGWYRRNPDRSSKDWIIKEY